MFPTTNQHHGFHIFTLAQQRQHHAPAAWQGAAVPRTQPRQRPVFRGKTAMVRCCFSREGLDYCDKW